MACGQGQCFECHHLQRQADDPRAAGGFEWRRGPELDHEVVLVATRGEAIALGIAHVITSAMAICNHGCMAKIKRFIRERYTYPRRSYPCSNECYGSGALKGACFSHVKNEKTNAMVRLLLLCCSSMLFISLLSPIYSGQFSTGRVMHPQA